MWWSWFLWGSGPQPRTPLTDQERRISHGSPSFAKPFLYIHHHHLRALHLQSVASFDRVRLASWATFFRQSESLFKAQRIWVSKVLSITSSRSRLWVPCHVNYALRPNAALPCPLSMFSTLPGTQRRDPCLRWQLCTPLSCVPGPPPMTLLSLLAAQWPLHISSLCLTHPGGGNLPLAQWRLRHTGL